MTAVRDWGPSGPAPLAAYRCVPLNSPPIAAAASRSTTPPTPSRWRQEDLNPSLPLNLDEVANHIMFWRLPTGEGLAPAAATAAGVRNKAAAAGPLPRSAGDGRPVSHPCFRAWDGARWAAVIRRAWVEAGPPLYRCAASASALESLAPACADPSDGGLWRTMKGHGHGAVFKLTNGGEQIAATGPLESRPTMLPACCGACSSYITRAALLHEACRRSFAPS